MAAALVVHPARAAAVAGRERLKLVRQPHRSLRAGPAGTGRSQAVTAGRARHAHPPPHARPDRPAPNAARGRCLPPIRNPQSANPQSKPSSTACSPRPATASAWRPAGWTPPAMPTPTAIRATASGTCGAGATGSSMRSTPTCRSISSRSSSSPATCSRRPTLEQRIATGFNRNHRGNAEGGIVPEEYAVEYVVDRVETTSTVWLGLTMGCARCHDHKYDPLTQSEFYRLYAYFNNVPERGKAIKYRQLAADDPGPHARAATAAGGARMRTLAAAQKRFEAEPGRADGLAVSMGTEFRAVAGRGCCNGFREKSLRSLDWPADGEPVRESLTASARSMAGLRCRRRGIHVLRQVQPLGLDQAGWDRGGTIVSRMTDQEAGRRLLSRPRRRQAASEPGQALARTTPSAWRRKQRCRQTAGITCWPSTTARAWPPACRCTSTAGPRSCASTWTT